MTDFLNKLTPASGLLASALVLAMTANASAWEQPATHPAEKPAVAETVSFNGFSCEHVRAKVAESGITAAYAYARYIGLSSRDIARVRKACSV